MSGTYIGGYGDYIYQCDFDEITGEMSRPSPYRAEFNPSFLARTPKGAIVNVNEDDRNAECYVSVSKDGRFTIKAGYLSGNITVYRAKDGKRVSLKVGGLFQPAHMHCCVFDKTGKRLICADLANDMVFSFAFNPKTGKLTETRYTAPYHDDKGRNGLFNAPRNSGPRHVVFNKANTKLFAITELIPMLLAYDYYKPYGQLTLTSATALDCQGATGADIHLSPDERFIYVSLRQTNEGCGGDSIALFKNGEEPEFVAAYPSGGKIPRNFAVTERCVIAANQATNNVVSFQRNPETGEIGRKLSEIFTPNPTCVLV